MGLPMRRLVTVLLAVTLLSGCAATPPLSPGASGAPASGGPVPSGGGPSGSDAPLQLGPVDPSVVAGWLPPVTADPQAIAAQAAALGVDLRKSLNAAAEYGQDAADLETLLDKTESDALTKLQDELKVKLGQASLGAAHLAAYRPSPLAPAHTADTAMLALSWVVMLIMAGIAIGSFDPKAGDIPEVTLSVPLGGSGAGATMSVTTSLTFSVTGPLVSATMELSGGGSMTNPTSGRVSSISGTTAFSFTINPCPDPAGGVNGTIAVHDEETISSPGLSTVAYRITGSADYQLVVNDQAEIATTSSQSRWDEATTRTFDGRSRDTDLAFSATTAFSSTGGEVPDSPSTITTDNMDGVLTGDDARGAVQRMATMTQLTPLVLGGFAADVWKGGKCFEVRPSPGDTTVTTGSQTQVKVTVHHWVDKADVALPVKATLTGVKTIDPAGQPVTSPATFTFTAGPPNSKGEVEYKVVSRRGIGSATRTFKVNGNLSLDITGTLKMNAAGIWIYNLRIAGTDIQLTAADDGTISATGQVTVKGTATAPIGACTATINEKIGVQARGQIQGPDDAQVFHVLLGPTSENNLGEKVSCPGITLPTNEGDYFGQWSTTIGEIDIPVAGGSFTKNGSSSGLLDRRAKGTFKATPS